MVTPGRIVAAVPIQTFVSMVTGAPVLDQAVVVFDCRITQIVEVGTHDVFFCEVEGIVEGDVHEGLIYYGRTYHPVRLL